MDLSSHDAQVIKNKWLAEVSLSLTTGSVWTRWQPGVSQTLAMADLTLEVEEQIAADKKHIQDIVKVFSEDLKLPCDSDAISAQKDAVYADAEEMLAHRLAQKLSLPKSIIFDVIQQLAPENIQYHASLPGTLAAVGETFIAQYEAGHSDEKLHRKANNLLDKWISFVDQPGAIFDSLCAYALNDQKSISQVEGLLST